MRKSTVIILILVAVLAIAAYLLKTSLLAGRDAIESLSGTVTGAPVEVRITKPGKITHSAANGDRVKKGDIIIKVDMSELVAQANALETELKALSSSLTPDQNRLLAAYRSMPGSLEEAEADFIKVQQEEELGRGAVIEASTAHSAIMLKIRALEIKQGMTPAETQQLRDYYAEENLLAIALGKARADSETASEKRAEAERELQKKRNMDRAFNSLPGRQKDTVLEISALLDKIYELEKEIADSKQTSAINARVIEQKFQPGMDAELNDLALLLLPEVSDALTVSAFFDPAAMTDIPSGTLCSVTINADPPFTLSGTLLDRLPNVSQDNAAGVPYKIRLVFQNTDNLLRLRTGQPATVKILPKND